MSYRIPASAFVALLLSAGAANPSWAQDQACVDVARIGLVDKENIRTIEDRIERIFLYTRSERDSTSSDIDRLFAAADIPVGDILVGASGSWSQEEYQRIRQMDERTFKRYVHDMVAKHSNRATANDAVARVVDKCLNRYGFAAWPSFGPGNYQTPSLTLSYQAPRELTDNPKLNVTLSYPPEISCTHNDRPATKVELQSGNPVILRCKRVEADANSVLVVVTPDTPTTSLTGGEIWFPPTAEPFPLCTKAVAERIEVDVNKSKDWFQEIGPFCGPVSITMAAKAEAKAQPGTQGGYSELVVYRGTAPTTDRIFINDRKDWKDLRTMDWTGLGAGPRRLEIPAYQREKFLLTIDDRLTDTEQGLWVIDINPR
ncbi:MAG: hypothetical protein IT203_02510 [Fimbriimonadaceae bacterium]|nr:hypothetical protein [Fimbriimonadaceae bacterium]